MEPMTKTARRTPPPPPPFNGNVRARVLEVRQRLDVTQQEFATLLGLSTVSVSRWERDHTQPTEASEALLILLERALGRVSGPKVIDALRDLHGKPEAERLVALVHLGD